MPLFLCHCGAGVHALGSRSSSLVLLWLMEKHGLSLREANEYAKQRRPYINPNPGFLCQLGRHEERLRGETTIRFPRDGAPLTVKTVYEWKMADGAWVPRQTFTGHAPPE